MKIWKGLKRNARLIGQLKIFSFFSLKWGELRIKVFPVTYSVTLIIILGDRGAVSRVGRKGGTKVFITGERAPGYRLSPDHFQKFKRSRLLIGHKKCFVLLCPIGEHISMSSFRVFVNDGHCLDHGLSSLCTKDMHAVRKLSVWYKIPIWSNSLTLSNARKLFRTIAKFMKRMNVVIACLLLRKTWS